MPIAARADTRPIIPCWPSRSPSTSARRPSSATCSASRDGELVIIRDGDGQPHHQRRGGHRRAHHSPTCARSTPGGSGASRSASPRWRRRSNWRGERGGALNLEIKGESVEDSVGTAEAVEPVLRALEEPLRARLLVSSFEHPAVALLKERLPWLRVATLYSGREWQKEDMLAPALAIGAEAIHPGVSPDYRRTDDSGA